MGILSETAKVRPRGKSITYLKEKGYDVKIGQEIDVKVEDLSPCSTVLIRVACDYCGKEREPMRYVDYNAQTKNGKNKCCCLNCVPLKREDAMIEKYGYRNAAHVPEIRQKIEDTNIARYGSISPSGSAKVIAKQKDTLMKNYGVENPSLSKEIQGKRKQTFVNKYGVESSLLVEEVKEKIRQTIFERYGVENVSQNPDVQNKRTQTFIDNFGATSPLKNKECLEKMKQTNFKIYGVEFIPQLEETKQKVKKTNLKNCGYEYYMQSPEFLEKWFAKNGANFVKHSRQQRYLCNLYNGILNYPFKCFALDIYLPDGKLDIEFDGSGHKMSVSFGTISEDDFEKKELYRNVAIKKAGMKQMRIISTTDKLPSDEILLQMLSEARQYFSYFPQHSWIEFNIDTSTMRNAEHKDGIPYSYGPLRAIKESDLQVQQNTPT